MMYLSQTSSKSAIALVSCDVKNESPEEEGFGSRCHVKKGFLACTIEQAVVAERSGVKDWDGHLEDQGVLEAAFSLLFLALLASHHDGASRNGRNI